MSFVHSVFDDPLNQSINRDKGNSRLRRWTTLDQPYVTYNTAAYDPASKSQLPAAAIYGKNAAEYKRATGQGETKLSRNGKELFSKDEYLINGNELFKTPNWDGKCGQTWFAAWCYPSPDSKYAVHAFGPFFRLGNSEKPPPATKFDFAVMEDGCVRLTEQGHRTLGYFKPAIFAGEVTFDGNGYVQSWNNKSGTYPYPNDGSQEWKLRFHMMPFPKTKYTKGDASDVQPTLKPYLTDPPNVYR
jgi:hypothetical protein